MLPINHYFAIAALNRAFKNPLFLAEYAQQVCRLPNCGLPIKDGYPALTPV